MSLKEINNKPYTISEYFKRMLAFSFLIRSLAAREFKVKYARAVLGVGWVVIQPLVAVIIYSIFFNYLIKISTNDIPYIQFVFSGLVLWYMFTGILGKCSTALLESTELINKVSFPRIILLISKAFPVMVESLVLYLVLLGILIFQNGTFKLQYFISVFYLLQVFIWAFSVSIIFSVVIIRLRDFLHVLPFIMNFGIWLTPVFYPVSIVPESYRGVLKFANPIAHSIESFRNTLFGDVGINRESFTLLLISLIFLYVSLVIFIKFEKQIVERL